VTPPAVEENLSRFVDPDPFTSDEDEAEKKEGGADAPSENQGKEKSEDQPNPEKAEKKDAEKGTAKDDATLPRADHFAFLAKHHFPRINRPPVL